jgi:hypothetical protein
MSDLQAEKHRIQGAISLEAEKTRPTVLQERVRAQDDNAG